MNQFTELTLVENTAIEIFQNLWWKDCFTDAFKKEGEEFLGRRNRGEVVLTKFLEPKLIEINPELPREAVLKAMEILLEDKWSKTIERANKEVYDYIKEGVSVHYTDDNWNEEIGKVKIIDLENAENNDYMLVTQMWITWDTYTRRPDLIGFVSNSFILKHNFLRSKSIHFWPYPVAGPWLQQYDQEIHHEPCKQHPYHQCQFAQQFYTDWQLTGLQIVVQQLRLSGYLKNSAPRDFLLVERRLFFFFGLSSVGTIYLPWKYL